MPYKGNNSYKILPLVPTVAVILHQHVRHPHPETPALAGTCMQDRRWSHPKGHPARRACLRNAIIWLAHYKNTWKRNLKGCGINPADVGQWHRISLADHQRSRTVSIQQMKGEGAGGRNPQATEAPVCPCRTYHHGHYLHLRCAVDGFTSVNLSTARFNAAADVAYKDVYIHSERSILTN